jgi:hypothetical protein
LRTLHGGLRGRLEVHVANTPIPLALKTGNLTVFTESTMTRILMKDAGHVAGIEFTKATAVWRQCTAEPSCCPAAPSRLLVIC